MQLPAHHLTDATIVQLQLGSWRGLCFVLLSMERVARDKRLVCSCRRVTSRPFAIFRRLLPPARFTLLLYIIQIFDVLYLFKENKEK